MKKLFLILLALILTGCAVSEEIPTETEEVVRIEENEPLNVIVETSFLEECEGSAKVDNVLLTDEAKEKYPLLAKSMDEENKLNKECIVQEYDMYAQETEYFSGYDTSLEASIKRSDEKVLSISYYHYVYTGGAHPIYYYTTSNFEPESGKKLTLGDVFTDTAILPGLIRNKLIEEYGSDAFYDIENEEFGNLTASNTDSWSIGYDRITFYFLPYELAPHAAGLIKTELFFDEYSDIINNVYMDTPASYAVEITDGWEGFVCDINPLSEGKDIIKISTEYQDEMYSRLIFEINGIRFGHNVWFYENREYFVHLEEDGNIKNYIYVEATSENDYPTILVFEVSEKKISCVGEIPGTGFVYKGMDYGFISYKFTNPLNFKLGTRMDMFSTYSGAKEYYVDFNTGMPKTDMDYYTVDVDYVLTNRIPVTVWVLPEKTEAIIAEGESFTFLRTDNETFVDMKLSGGSEVRIMVEMIDGWAAGTEGLPAWDVFDGVMYAG